MSPADDTEIKRRLGELELELVALRRLLKAAPENLPDCAFDVLELRAGESWYALPIDAIREVLSMLWAEPMADAPPWVLGSFRYADEAVVLIDLEARLAGTTDPFDPARLVVVLERPALRAFVVAEIRDLRRIVPSEVKPPAPGITQAPFLLGSVVTGTSVLHLLSPELIGRELVFDEHAG